MKKHVLFVDPRQDEPHGAVVLAEGLSGDWDSTIVSCGSKALAAMDQRSYDVIVSELALPDMNGASLFKEVAEKSPGTVRFILSRDVDKDIALKTIGFVHQCIGKPCPANDLAKLLKNSMGLHRLLSNPELHSRIASVKSLPSPPELYNKLVLELQKEEASFSKVADLIRQDIAISAKLFQLINSAFIGLRNPVESTQQAVTMLGLDSVRQLVLTASVFEQFEAREQSGFSIDSIYSHSMAIGSSARLIANAFGLRRRYIEDSLMAGMLHDVGKLVMLTHFPDELRRARELADNEDISLHDAVEKILGVSDTDIGAHLLSLWGLPDSVLEAVALHCRPMKAPCPIMNVLTAVHIAYALFHDEANRIHDDNLSAVDMDYLKVLQLDQQLPAIRNFGMAAVS